MLILWKFWIHFTNMHKCLLCARHCPVCQQWQNNAVPSGWWHFKEGNNCRQVKRIKFLMMVGFIQTIKQSNERAIVIASPGKKVWKSSEAILKASVATKKWWEGGVWASSLQRKGEREKCSCSLEPMAWEPELVVYVVLVWGAMFPVESRQEKSWCTTSKSVRQWEFSLVQGGGQPFGCSQASIWLDEAHPY